MPKDEPEDGRPASKIADPTSDGSKKPLRQRRTPAIKLVTGESQREDKEAKEDRKPKANTARDQAKAEREAKGTQIPITAERKKQLQGSASGR